VGLSNKTYWFRGMFTGVSTAVYHHVFNIPVNCTPLLYARRWARDTAAAGGPWCYRWDNTVITSPGWMDSDQYR